MKNHKNCPICKQELIIDVSKLMSCAMCGMVLDIKNMLLFVEDGEEKYFCLYGCYEKYLSINKIAEARR